MDSNFVSRGFDAATGTMSMDKIICNFDIAECFSGTDDAPGTGSNFESWIAGGDPTIDPMFAELAWYSLYEAISYFSNTPDENLSAQQIEGNLYKCFVLIQDHLNRIYKGFPDPFEFYSYILDYENPEFMFGMSLEFPSDQIMAAYAILCIDQSISSLRTSNAKKSAKFSMFVGVSLSVSQRYLESDLTTNSRNAANKRHKNDPKQAAKRLVKDCWLDWKISPARYSGQTAFANDILTKVDTNDRGDPIITFDTIVKKWIPMWTREKK